MDMETKSDQTRHKVGLFRQSVSDLEIQETLNKYDLDGDGTIDKNEVRMLVRNFIEEKNLSYMNRNLIFLLVGIVLIMSASNIGTAYLAVQLQKDVKVLQDGALMSKDGKMVSVRARGEFLSVDNSSIPFSPNRRELLSTDSGFELNNITASGCVRAEDFAVLYSGFLNGENTGIFMKNENGDVHGYNFEVTGHSLTSDYASFHTNQADIYIYAYFDDTMCQPMENLARRYLSHRENKLYLRAHFDFYVGAHLRGHNSKVSASSFSTVEEFFQANPALEELALEIGQKYELSPDIFHRNLLFGWFVSLFATQTNPRASYFDGRVWVE